MKVLWCALTVACAMAVGIAWISAQGPGDDDDRSQIIVRSGSIIIENGKGNIPPTPWTHDAVLSELKPQDKGFKEVSGFEVTFENAYAACGASTPSTPPVSIPAMTGNDVGIDFSYSKVVRGASTAAVTTVHFHLRKAHLGGLAGKEEPKLDDLGFTDTSTQPPPALQQLQAPLASDAWISRVVVASNGSPCTFPAPPDDQTRRNFHVLLQPKASR